MHAGTVFVVCPLIFAALWTGLHAASPLPSIPDRVQALVGSCVVIPCSFTPPAPRMKQRVDVRLRFRSGGPFFPLQRTAFNSQDGGQVSRDFRGRVSLVGQMADGDCSLKIERVRKDDPQVFEISLKIEDDLLWEKRRSFNFDITDSPEPPIITGMSSATEGQLITLNCSISYHCPTTPPSLKWRWERGAQTNRTELEGMQTLHVDPQKRKLLASLSFTASHQVKPRLRCEVMFPEVKALSTSRELHVTFPPKDVRIQVQSLMVQEGGTAFLTCSCKADPPASEYRWSYRKHGHTVHLHQQTHAVRVFNVTRDMTVRCSAQNLIGRGESQFTSLNVQYKPIIVQPSSACIVNGSELVCHCSVDSNPKPAVTWSVNGSVPPNSYNISVTSEPNMLTVTMRGHMVKPQRVICFAVNALGNDSVMLLQGEEPAPLLWLVLPAAAAGCLVIALLILLVCCCRKKARKNVLNRHPAVYSEGMGIYQERMPIYINCTEVTHIYTNGSYQLMYQNSTPLFVRTKQVRPMGRRGGERRRGGEDGRTDRRANQGVRAIREVQDTTMADAETAIYLEII
ncbi:sialoadhesin [Pholidichthys leucotaenia]